MSRFLIGQIALPVWAASTIAILLLPNMRGLKMWVAIAVCTLLIVVSASAGVMGAMS